VSFIRGRTIPPPECNLNQISTGETVSDNHEENGQQTNPTESMKQSYFDVKNPKTNNVEQSTWSFGGWPADQESNEN